MRRAAILIALLLPFMLWGQPQTTTVKVRVRRQPAGRGADDG